MKKLLQLFRNHWPIVVLVLIEAILFLANYTRGTYLIGWDNLFPEFNIGLNIKRALFGVWQEYRGLGYEDGMSHAANLPHYFFIYLLSFVFPQNMLRYIFMFAMHLFGGIGLYFLLLKSKISENKVVAGLGALFYQYSFATIQMFYLPFELFIVHFGFLPWLILFLTEYLKTGKKKTLFWFALLSLLSTPQAHVPTIFIVYVMIVSFFLLFHFFSQRLRGLKKIAVIILVIFCTNAFWGIPFAYSTMHNAAVIANSKNNQMATEDIYLKNHKYGDFQSTALMRSFNLDVSQYDYQEGKNDIMMKFWVAYIHQPIIVSISWLFFAITVLGLVAALLKKNVLLYSLLALFLFVFAIIGNDIPVISAVSFVLRTYVPLFSSVFRFVFTKFFVVYAFVYAIFFALGLDTIVKIVPKKSRKIGGYILGFIIFAMVVIYSFPSFQGHFFHEQLRVKIPQEYFQVFDFFSKQPESERIAVLPAPWYWAWTPYKWGVIGSGFEWFGIKQPLLDRAFDPWNQENENFYWEISQAIYISDPVRFQQVLQKYHVTWLLVDNNIMTGDNPVGAINVKNLEATNFANQIQLVATFGNIKIYKVYSHNTVTQPISAYTQLKNIGPSSIVNDKDTAIVDQPTYVTDETQPFDVYYPFRSLFTGKQQSDLEFQVENQGSQLVFKAKLPKNVQNYTVSAPPINDVTSPLNAPTVTLNPSDGSLEVIVPNDYRYNSDPWNDFVQPKRSCDPFNTGEYEHQILTENDRKILRLTSVSSSNCLSFSFPYLSQQYGYLVILDTKNIQNKGLFFSITNEQTGRTFLETYLEEKPNQLSTSYFVIPPMEARSKGYSLNFDNISIGRMKTVNELHRIQILQIPYDFLTNAKLLRPGATTTSQQLSSQLLSVTHPNYAEYVVKTTNNLSPFWLNLAEGYNPNWVAFTQTAQFPYVRTLGKDIKVDNWSNGWKIEKAGTIFLLFWPQLLEFFGFIFLPFAFFFCFVPLRKQKKKRDLKHVVKAKLSGRAIIKR